MKNKIKVWVVTDIELGWDNVIGVYTSEEEAYKCANSRGEDVGIVHEKELENEFIGEDNE